MQHHNDERTTRTVKEELQESSESEDDQLQDSSNSERRRANSSTAKVLTQVSLTGDLYGDYEKGCWCALRAQAAGMKSKEDLGEKCATRVARP